MVVVLRWSILIYDLAGLRRLLGYGLRNIINHAKSAQPEEEGLQMPSRIKPLLVVFVLSLSSSSCSMINQAQSHPRVQVQTSQDSVPAAWSRLHKGLDQNQVKALLGPPPYIRNSGTQLFWFYEYGTLTFEGASSVNSMPGTDGRLVSWMRE